MKTNDKIINGLEVAASTVIKVIFLCLIIGLFIISFIGSAVVDIREHTTYINDNIILNLSSILILCFMAVFLKKKKIKISNNFLYVGIIIWFILCFFWIFLNKMYPINDQYYILDIATNLKKGDCSSFYKRFLLRSISFTIWNNSFFVWINVYI